ncbi:MAG: aminoglycoside phosphotransferase family protein [Solirubrobacteraceae bacterium]
MTDSSADSPVLSAAETGVAESLLASRWATGVVVRDAETIWDRSHIVRLRLADDDRTAVLKRPRGDNSGDRTRGFDAELAALEFLSPMETAVAPRLLGADAAAGILLMEDLGPGSSLADSLLAGDRGRAEADLIGYARALAAMHAWSVGRSGEYAELRARLAGSADVEIAPDWMAAITRSKGPFLAMAGQLGLATDGVDQEIDSLAALMAGAGYVGLVHGDLCPDNTHIADGSCRIIDFETSGWGPIALDVAYLLAPFPSCWCFASLPAEAAGPALLAYRDQVTNAGVDLGPDWEVALTAALAGWVVARVRIGRALEEDSNWGTTTMRPRLLTWLHSFIEAASRTDALPRLRSLAEAIRELLLLRWPDAVVPDYPALARPGAPLARVPRDPNSD